MIKLMKASAEKLESVEGIDSGMAATIIETRETQQYIDLYIVSEITGLPRKTLKESFLQPSPWLSIRAKHENKTNKKLARTNEQQGVVKQELQQVKGLCEAVDTLTIKVQKIESSQQFNLNIRIR